jgi:hypothetical protein
MTPRLLLPYPPFVATESDPDARWSERFACTDDGTLRTYSPRERFEPGDMISHATLGPGLVLASAAHELEALFAFGVRALPQLPLV